MKHFIASIALAACAFSAFALPTVDNVQAEIGRGNYAQAESMMLEVVTAKPNSAKAHYIYAEILAHNKHFAQAVEEAAQAKKIDPALGFTQPEKFRAFEQLLDREQAGTRRVAPVSAERAAVSALPEKAQVERSSGIPGWIWGLGGAAAALIAWRMLSARRPTPSSTAPLAAGVPTGPTYGSGYGPAYAPPQASPGSGLLGTGMAVAGGVAAGMLAEKLFEGHRESASGLPAALRSDGLVPGMFDNAPSDDAAARDLEQRDVDFGSGGDWGGDAAGSTGGSDGW